MTGLNGKSNLSKKSPYLELNNQGQVLTFELTQNQHILGRDRTRADLVVPETWRVISAGHLILRQIGDTYYIYDGDGQQPSTNGLFVNHTRITAKEGYRLRSGVEITIGQNPKNQMRLRYFDPNNPTTSPYSVIPPISLKERSVMLGRDSTATVQLDSPIVSRCHGIIEPDDQGHYILNDYSANGIFVNGKRIQKATRLLDNDTIRIGPFTLMRQGDNLAIMDLGDRIRLDAERLLRLVRDRRGKSKVLLSDLTFAIEPGQFVALVGGSGAGKSTLMRTLLGLSPTTKGSVYLNGDELQQNFNLYRHQIGYVPQDDIIHRDLTVGEVLTYAAKLRLPPDGDIEATVTKTLYEIEMLDRRDVMVSQLSGGQRKRVSIGVELLADPKLFFLDEPTSGLDPGLDKKMMELLRRLANQGRTVILVTHATANMMMCDRVVFLGRGGRLCYFGPPGEAFEFFELDTGDFADIYNLLEEGEAIAQEWSLRFRKSPQFQNYVVNHLTGGETPEKNRQPATHKLANIPRQLSILTQRYGQLIKRDKFNLLLNLLTAPVGILLIRLAIGDRHPFIGDADTSLASLARQVLFVFTCAAIWVGLSSSLQELVKETAIYARERLVNLRIVSYLGSKFLILSGLALLQTLLMVGIISLCFSGKSHPLFPWILGVSITTFLTIISAMSLGVLVSARVENSAQANSALPLLLLPQIIFSGVLFKMSGISRVVSWLMVSRWSMGAYGSLGDINSLIPPPVTLPDGTIIPQPFELSSVYEPTWENLLLNWGMLGLHLFIYWGLTAIIQKQKDII
ncbi:MAG: ATP-binding cassette domain-containing protein [Arthrospira sp. SH-MAG29]|nr:ATP-binding cassette domain-containing protein [Arthrospira sp. SH-MAG29]MBS0017579.1 ATP-binding cassette domain-containing protein [Arthrospira sp. SH-MAG29]